MHSKSHLETQASSLLYWNAVVGFLLVLAVLAPRAFAGTISGTVKDPAGAAFRGAFVRARNQQTKMTVNVLSDVQGRYRLQNLPVGDYDIRATAVGFDSDLHDGVKVAVADSLSMDFSLKKGMVRWSDLSISQGRRLLPQGRGRTEALTRCVSCHGFQSRMAEAHRDQASWIGTVKFMRDSMHFIMSRVTDENAANMAAYLNQVFGTNSDLTRSPADVPGYRETVRHFSDEAMKISYVDYEMPAPNRFPWSGAPDKNGNVWIPYYGRANRIGRLNPDTGEIQEFRVPNEGTAGIHSAVAAPDGTVWLAEQGSNKIGKWDPNTQTVTEYQDSYVPGKEGITPGGSKHTIVIGPDGSVWATATSSPLTRLDPKTGKMTHFPEVMSSYGLAFDKDGNAWFAQEMDNGKIGRVDAKTDKVKMWLPPTGLTAHPRRIQVARDGMIWFSEYTAGKIGRFDPKTEAFKEYPLPGPEASPYAIAIDKNNDIWYSSEWMDVIGRLNTKTGQVTEYPFPYPENTVRDFFFDAQGHMWFGSPANNKVGYIILPSGS